MQFLIETSCLQFGLVEIMTGSLFIDQLLLAEMYMKKAGPFLTLLFIYGYPLRVYFLNFLLIPIKPIKPEPSNQIAPGIGTGFIRNVIKVIPTRVVPKAKVDRCQSPCRDLCIAVIGIIGRVVR